ncbi:hypothetical protein G7046_g4298 [Stylonectria norvegica]|nr:hypothetical protein G7046_g4298 [Stylonectria norvegica]
MADGFLLGHLPLGVGSSLARLATRLSPLGLADAALPGTYLPDRGSLIDIVLHKLACDWEFHRVYNQYHLYFVPNHLKPALIRFIGIASPEGLSLANLKAILLPPPDTFDEDELETLMTSNTEVNCLDLLGSVGRSIKLKDLGDLLFHNRDHSSSVEPQDSWDVAQSVPSPSRTLLPNLTHLSLALDPRYASSASWKHLLTLSSKLSTLTHLSLAYWPDPCFTPRARLASVESPQGNRIPYGGTNFYSHSLDHDWSEALLVLRMLSKNLYALEYLDLTGCSSWFQALMTESETDYVDWVGNWGKITRLRLYTGSDGLNAAKPSEVASFLDAVEMARNIERHIRAKRAGKGCGDPVFKGENFNDSIKIEHSSQRYLRFWVMYILFPCLLKCVSKVEHHPLRQQIQAWPSTRQGGIQKTTKVYFPAPWTFSGDCGRNGNYSCSSARRSALKVDAALVGGSPPLERDVRRRKLENSFPGPSWYGMV